MKNAKNWGKDRVRRLRKRLGLTQEQFAQRVGVTFVTVNRWEAGHSAPRGLSLRELDRLDQVAA